MEELSCPIGTKHLHQWLGHSECSKNSSDEDDNDDGNQPVEKADVQEGQENEFRTRVASISN